MMELLSSVLWNVFLFTFVIFLFSLPSPLFLLQTYLTTNSIYIVDAAEPISLLFIFFLILGTVTFPLNYYFQIYLNKGSTIHDNTPKRLFNTITLWSLFQLSVARLPKLVGKHIKIS